MVFFRLLLPTIPALTLRCCAGLCHDCREQHAQQLLELSQRLAAAEAAQQAGVQSMGSILTSLTERTAAILASRAAATPLPFHRPPSGHYMQQQKLTSSSSRPASSSSSMGRTMSPNRTGTWGSPGPHQCHQQQEQQAEDACSRPHSAYSTVSIYQHQQQQSPLRQRPQSAFTTGPNQQSADNWGVHPDQQQQQQSSRLGSSSRSRTSSPSRPATATLSRAAAATAVFTDSEGEEEEVEMVDCSRLDTAAAADEAAGDRHMEGGAVDGAATHRTGGPTPRSPRPRSSRPAGQQLTVTLAPDVTDGSDTWGVSDTASPKDVTRTLLAGGMTTQQQQQQRELVQEASLASAWAGQAGAAAGVTKSNRKGRAQAMELLCDRLMAENAFLLAELSKWEGGWHSCQVYGTGAAASHPTAGGPAATLQAAFSTTKPATAAPGGNPNATLAAGNGGGGGEGQALPQQHHHTGLTLSRPCSAASTAKRQPSAGPSRALATGEELVQDDSTCPSSCCSYPPCVPGDWLQ